MTTLKTLLNNPYANKRLTDTRLVGAALVILPKYTALNAGGVYTDVIAAINAANTPMLKKIGEIKTDLAFGKGFTENREEVAANFLAFVKKNRKVIMGKYVDAHSKELQFYPNGMEDYNAGNKTTWVSLMKFFADAATTNSADFPAQFVTDANAFEGTYTAASDVQAGKQATTDTDRATRNTLRNPLSKALWRGMITAFLVNDGNEDAIKAIVDLKSLEPHKRTPMQHLNGDIDGDKTLNLMQENFDISYVFFIKNTGTTDLRFCLSPDATTACTENGETLRGGKTHTFLAPSLGDLTNQFFNVTNLDPTTQGKFEISVYRQ